MIQVHILSPDSIEDQKKGLYWKLKGFCPTNRVQTEKKEKEIFIVIWDSIWPDLGISSSWLALFRFMIQRWNLDGGTLNLMVRR